MPAVILMFFPLLDFQRQTMRRIFVIFLLFLFPFQVFAARLDCRTPAAAHAVQAMLLQAELTAGASIADRSDLAGVADIAYTADEYRQTGKVFDLAAQACEDADEPSAHFDLGDILAPRVTALSPPQAFAPRPGLAALPPSSLFPSVPKPPPDA